MKNILRSKLTFFHNTVEPDHYRTEETEECVHITQMNVVQKSLNLDDGNRTTGKAVHSIDERVNRAHVSKGGFPFGEKYQAIDFFHSLLNCRN